ncbi:MAG: Loki-CTERM sorting domain-containing protein [Promethearchaeota archaeon]
MKHKFLTVSILALMALIPIVSIFGFEYIDNINDGISVYFLVDLEAGENIEINVTHTGDGNFTLFLFDSRPSQTYVNDDKTLNPIIFQVALNYSVDDNPYINYTVSQPKIYYIELILIDNGPDTFFLVSNIDDLTRYYLPIVPGFQVELLIISSFLTIGLILILYKRRMRTV